MAFSRLKRAWKSMLKSRYEAAEPSPLLDRHFSWADNSSINQLLTPSTRALLRARSRYEISNNSYACGMAVTYANDLIGKGPRAQVRLMAPFRDNEVFVRAAATLERSWHGWAREVSLHRKKRTTRESEFSDGEGFEAHITNPGLKHPVKMDIWNIEADRVAGAYDEDPNDFGDGISYDAYGNPVSYRVLKEHPGEYTVVQDADILPAADVIHMYKRRRPGQLRGLPEMTPALSLFAMLRRYTNATVTAAEVAADLALVLKTNTPLDEGPAQLKGKQFTSFKLNPGSATVLPDGWDLGGIKPEQPVNTYAQFKEAILSEIGRCMLIPFNVAAGNSSGYNFASGRLDHLAWYRNLDVERCDWENESYNVTFDRWFDEALLVGEVPPVLRDRSRWEVVWYWPATQDIDPLKTAKADLADLAANATTYSEIYGKKGQPWQDAFAQIAEEKRLMESLGITQTDVMASLAQNIMQQPEDGYGQTG